MIQVDSISPCFQKLRNLSSEHTQKTDRLPLRDLKMLSPNLCNVVYLPLFLGILCTFYMVQASVHCMDSLAAGNRGFSLRVGWKSCKRPL